MLRQQSILVVLNTIARTQPSAIFTYSNEKGVRSGGRKYTHAMLLILKDQKKRHENGIQFLFLP